ncbi:hypothetical protein OS493_023166 [Desmophyllum pertusum]|uniref:Uncharacterized protein n=1 Tax=Desmophyllum pertusum TaxID=174260 RepID=A0A9W9YYM8_9CNID|nr:hypothetical protein OS493_023166 [Desmophyllum pertusum]
MASATKLQRQSHRECLMAFSQLCRQHQQLSIVVPNGFPVNTLQYGPWSSSPPYVSGALGSHPHVNPPSSFVGNGAGPSTAIGTQPQQLPIGSLHISPVQTSFEPSSVPYYLQQDLEALQRVSQQYASPPLGQQSSPSQSMVSSHS